MPSDIDLYTPKLKNNETEVLKLETNDVLETVKTMISMLPGDMEDRELEIKATERTMEFNGDDMAAKIHPASITVKIFARAEYRNA